ncbi:hypothetical protein [Rhizobium rhizogenes]|nr:hypothetical protein [Rhizobium rhizogenes]
MDDVLDHYRRRVEKFDRTLEKQRTGAAAATVGFDFQEMVSVIEVLRLGQVVLDERLRGNRELYFIVEQNSFVAVDDFIVVCDSYRRHLQIKASDDPSWRERLVNSFWSDYFKFANDGNRRLLLELVVWSRDACEKMRRNMADHHLDRIRVEISSPTANYEAPFLDKNVRALLHGLSLVGGHDQFFQSMFGAVMAGWKNAGRRGEIREVFKQISRASLFTLTSLAKPDAAMMVMTDKLNRRIKELRFAADGDSLGVRYRYGMARVPEFKSYEWRTLFSAFSEGVPRDLLEFQEALGSRRKRNRKD